MAAHFQQARIVDSIHVGGDTFAAVELFDEWRMGHHPFSEYCSDKYYPVRVVLVDF